MLEDVEVGVHPLVVLEGVGVGHQMTANAIGMDDLLNAHGLVEVGFVARRDIPSPADWLVGDAKRAEDLPVEVVIPEEELVDAAEELPGLRSLDDAMVVGRGEGEDLRDGIARNRLR